ncbi:MAG: oligosaccharide flippase family protein [Bacteroidaceae bacterium]|nr:oligosaccharide flippase family protein [Bacteroidaceae bacterium]
METESKEQNYGHILKYTGIFGGVQGLNIAIGLVRNKIVASLLGPGGMGLVALFNSTVNFVSQATNLGISFSAVRHVSELFDTGDEERIAHFVKVVRAWSLLTALLGMLVCMVAGPLLSEYTFSWGDHTLHFVLLAPAVGLTAICGGETAILKGARQLRALAMIQIVMVFVSLIISVPIYYFFGETGIVPVMVLMALATMLLTLRYSYRLYPLRLSGSGGILGEGMGMVRLGVAFVAAGVLGSGAEMLVRSYLNVKGDLNMLGLYNAGFMLIVTYAGTVFSAMETDYFPRLSACCHDRSMMTLTVNRQIEVSFLMMAPMLVGLIVALPLLIPILFTREFVPVVAMAQVAVFSMYIKAVSLPISYLTLARGDSAAYLCLEAVYDVLLVVLMIVCYDRWSLFGTGVALTLSYLIDIVIIYGYAFLRYGYRVSAQVLQYLGIQTPLGIAAWLLTFVDQPFIYWTVGVMLSLASVAISLYILHQKTSLWTALTRKVRSPFSRH